MWNVLDAINAVLWHDAVLYTLLVVGVLFTVWTKVGQVRALTHGVHVIRGAYSKKGDPGAINHFQALSTALSGTVGLGNIAGVAVAVSLGGPGAVFWMWVVGLLGMAIKTTEVTQSMLFRDLRDPNNPLGGPMVVAREGFKKFGLAGLGTFIGAVFCVTLIISTFTGGNIFQAWSVAEITTAYFPDVPGYVAGIFMTVIVGLVIIGGIKRIGSVTGRLVPLMCGIYLIAAVTILIMNYQTIPGILRMIVLHALPSSLGGQSAEPVNAFLGGTFGYAFLWGMKRALFSNESGQGSSPIAHSAAKTDEPVREGVVAGLEPFIDTIIVCTLTALVILSTGAWNREAAAKFPDPYRIVLADKAVTTLDEAPAISAMDGTHQISPIRLTAEAAEQARARGNGRAFVLVRVESENGPRRVSVSGKIGNDGLLTFEPGTLPGSPIEVLREVYSGRVASWKPDVAIAPKKPAEEVRISKHWRVNDGVFVIVADDFDKRTGRDLHKVTGKIRASADETLEIEWDARSTATEPWFVNTDLHLNLPGPALTGYAFDRAIPDLGKWIVTVAAWLFAISTIISWSYYGEQGVVFLMGRWAVLPYKLIYCVCILIATLGFIKTDSELDALTALGTGVMLFANIPIMLIFSKTAMKAYHRYLERLDRGEFVRHAPPPIADVAEGKDE
ncbi:MAG: sodium:alanine symporter family protein [Phycisphaeraceae bacterium]|nr:sodium:alanine symporter family protein [Phycisphaeraceae bacterium]